MSINDILKSAPIEHQDLTFDQLHEKIKESALWQRAGAQIRLKGGELYLKMFNFNPLGDESVRAEKFAGAADAIRNAIDRQYGFQTVGDRTIGQHVLDQIALEHDGEYRVDFGDLDKVQKIIQAAREEYGLNLEDRSGDLQNQRSGVSASRISPSASTVAEGTRRLYSAILHDIITSDTSGTSTAADQEAAANRVMYELGAVKGGDGTFILAGGLSSENISRAVDTIEAIQQNADLPGIAFGADNVRALYEVTDLQCRIDVAAGRLNTLNHRLEKVADVTPSIAADKLRGIADENRALVRELRTLTYPDDLCSNDVRAELSNRIVEHCEKSAAFLQQELDAALNRDDLSKIDKEVLKGCRDIAVDQLLETLSLVPHLRRVSAQSLTVSYKTVDRKMLDGIADFDLGSAYTAGMKERLNQSIEVPRTLYGKSDSEGHASLEDASTMYNSGARNLLPFVERFGDLTQDERKQLARDLKDVLADNDAMLERISRRQRIRGNFVDHAAHNDLGKLQEMRYALQCLELQNLLMVEGPKRQTVTEGFLPNSTMGKETKSEELEAETGPGADNESSELSRRNTLDQLYDASLLDFDEYEGLGEKYKPSDSGEQDKRFGVGGQRFGVELADIIDFGDDEK